MKKLLLLIFILAFPFTASAAVRFNGTSNIYATQKTVDLTKSNFWTVTFWLNWPTYANNDALAWEESPNSNNNSFSGLADPNSTAPSNAKFQFSLNNSPGTGRVESFSRSLVPTSTPTALAVIFDNSTNNGDVRVFINAKEIATTVDTNTKAASGNGTAQKWYLMARGTKALFGTGNLYQMQIFNRALTTNEIRQAMYQPSSMKAGLMAYFPLWTAGMFEENYADASNNATTTSTATITNRDTTHLLPIGRYRR